MTTSPFAGTWHLQNWTALRNGDAAGFPMGPDAQGQIIYADDGHMCAFLMRADFQHGTELANVETCFSYGGEWSFADDQINHTVAFSSLPHWIGRVLVRNISRSGDILTLSTVPETSKSGTIHEHVLVWKKAAGS